MALEILRLGREGEAVRRWQRYLGGQGLLTSGADGVFGPLVPCSVIRAARRWKGSVRELVPIANEHGFYRGGHFSRRDGMHVELAQLP